VVLFVLIPLLITVGGGLLVEYIKPNPVYVGSGQGAVTPGAPVDSGKAAEVKKLLVETTWQVAEKPTVYGDTKVEFTSGGQVIRTYYRKLLGDEVTTHSYEVTPSGDLESEGKTNLELISLTKDQLVLSWDGTIVHYKRGWYWWEAGLAGAAAFVFLLIVACVKASSRRR
jgi:hypothetical protein